MRLLLAVLALRLTITCACGYFSWHSMSLFIETSKTRTVCILQTHLAAAADRRTAVAAADHRTGAVAAGGARRSQVLPWRAAHLGTASGPAVRLRRLLVEDDHPERRGRRTTAAVRTGVADRSLCTVKQQTTSALLCPRLRLAKLMCSVWTLARTLLLLLRGLTTISTWAAVLTRLLGVARLLSREGSCSVARASRGRVRRSGGTGRFAVAWRSRGSGGLSGGEFGGETVLMACQRLVGLAVRVLEGQMAASRTWSEGGARSRDQ